MKSGPIGKIFLWVLVAHLGFFWLFNLSISKRNSIQPVQKIRLHSVQMIEEVASSPPTSKVEEKPKPPPTPKVEEKPKPPPKNVEEKPKPPPKKVEAKPKAPQKKPQPIKKSASPKVAKLEKKCNKPLDTRSDSGPIDTHYFGLVVDQLQEFLLLPQRGAVTVNLSIDKNGKVCSLEIVKSESTVNAKYIKETLSGLLFPKSKQVFTGLFIFESSLT